MFRRIVSFFRSRVKRHREGRSPLVRLFTCARCRQETRTIVGIGDARFCPDCYLHLSTPESPEERAASMPAPCRGGPRSAFAGRAR